jgi:hypothetical protein
VNPVGINVVLTSVLCGLLFFTNSPAAEANNTSIATNARKDATFTELFRRSSGWVAGDGALSVPLSDGRVLWLFGDSHVDDLDLGHWNDALPFPTRNAAFIQKANDLKDVRTLVGPGPGFRSWFRNSTNESEWFWPGCGFQEGRNVYVYLSALRKTAGQGSFAFESKGVDYWVKIKFPEMQPISYVPLPSFNGIVFGQGFVKERDHVYAFGQKPRHLGCDIYAADSREMNLK